MGNDADMKWIRGGALSSLVLAVIFSLFRRWRLARLSAALSAAFVEKWRETHLGAHVRDLLAKAGRDA
ncbi:MAG: hypothetical protein JWP91_2855 [Fibrobacteres bacterium]|nr:hypothetical protein [Fibrobacterota bacterium]